MDLSGEANFGIDFCDVRQGFDFLASFDVERLGGPGGLGIRVSRSAERRTIGFRRHENRVEQSGTRKPVVGEILQAHAE